MSYRRSGAARLATRRLVLAALLLPPLVTAACSDPLDPEQDALERATNAWQSDAPSDYSFVFDQSCFCALVGPVRLTVRGGTIEQAEALEGSSAPGTMPPVEYFETIDGLLANLEATLEQEPVTFEVAYDAELGYPVRVQIDVSEQIADEEIFYEIREFTPLEESGS